ncbi:unnamed protein product [Dovyalis caffra]|uniref:Uncharacterized protein n=1 Tax=Dovyalis caffra TaxID=77055 RepID=A0AAV1R571_9ROSI|nr:unnamed protein product [Dovyalis caffra]
MGHWYGYVTPEDVPEILDQHIEKGIVIERIWRTRKPDWERNETWSDMNGEILVKIGIVERINQCVCSCLKNVPVAAVIIGVGKKMNNLLVYLTRGQMGLSTEEGEQKLPNGKDETKSNKHEETITEAARDNGGSCCQGANGFSCCRDGSSEIIKEKKLEENVKGHRKTGLDKLSRWIGSVEQSEVLAAVAVVGAVATVAVAYSFYKRSG